MERTKLHKIGVGKTTLVKAIADDFRKEKIPFSGFYTEEVRSVQNKRIGFDVMTFTGNRSILARHNDVTQVKSFHRVGQYNVHLGEFEKMIDQTLRDPSTNKMDIIIIDEVWYIKYI